MRRREITLVRSYDAAPEIVFKAWTDAPQVAEWWGPHGFTNPVCEVDARPGGIVRIDMQAPDGTAFPMTGVCREVTAPERIVLATRAFLDEQGRAQLSGVITAAFSRREGGGTELTLHATAAISTEELAGALEGMDAGWGESLDRLAEFLAKAAKPAGKGPS